jgi:8-oxo-dGTP pyrophosphatase MutT (NUDIX family)
MAIWRPEQRIKTKAIGLHWRGNRLLAAEVPDDSGRIKGVRPLGGSVEFGERADVAVVREFREELEIDVTVVGAPLVAENIYMHEGTLGHEVLFIYEVAFPAGAFSGQERIAFCEDDGTPCFAGWYDLDTLNGPGQLALFPDGLKDLLALRPTASR